MSDLLTIDEAAAYLRCSTKTLRRLVGRGNLPERRIGSGKLLFVQEELDAVLLKTGPTATNLISSASDTAPSSDDDWINAKAGILSQKKVG